MAEPFKNVFNPHSITQLGDTLARSAPQFKHDVFCQLAIQDLEQLSLKQRSDQIVLALRNALPEDFTQSAEIIHCALSPTLADHTDWTMNNTGMHEEGISGWLIMPLTEFVGRYGQLHFEQSMALFHSLTQRFSAEFGIRHFLKAMPQKTLSVLHNWTQDPSVHVRRLVSEGTRPTLPWGIKLPHFLEDPSYTFPLLEKLKDDDEEYVRRSVANHLNDLSKVHPDWFVSIANKWFSDGPVTRNKVLRHAGRTLFKQGHPKLMALFGYEPLTLHNLELKLDCENVEFGDALIFTLSGNLKSQRLASAMVDFVIHHKKANGSLSPKVFKWKTLKLSPNETFSWTKIHAIKAITTRKYYAGEHRLDIVINGSVVAQAPFVLKM